MLGGRRVAIPIHKKTVRYHTVKINFAYVILKFSKSSHWNGYGKMREDVKICHWNGCGKLLALALTWHTPIPPRAFIIDRKYTAKSSIESSSHHTSRSKEDNWAGGAYACLLEGLDKFQRQELLKPGPTCTVAQWEGVSTALMIQSQAVMREGTC